MSESVKKCPNRAKDGRSHRPIKTLVYLAEVESADERPITDAELDEYVYREDGDGEFGEGEGEGEGEGVSAQDAMVDAEDTHRAIPPEVGGRYGLVHEDGTPCDARTIESCPHERRAVRADSLSTISPRKGKGETMSRTTALHDAEWHRAKLLLAAAKAKSAKWLAENPGENVFFNPHAREVGRCEVMLREAKASEEARWSDDERHGVFNYREWYDSKGRRVVSRWRNGRWTTCYDRMDPGEARAFRGEHLAKVKANRKIHPQVRNPFRQRMSRLKAQAARWGVSNDVMKTFGDEYLESSGRKLMSREGFLGWLADRGIPRDWRVGDREAPKRYVEMVSAGGSGGGLRPETTLAGRLAGMGMNQIPQTAGAESVPGSGPGDGSGGAAGGVDRGVSPQDFAMRIAQEMKDRYS